MNKVETCVVCNNSDLLGITSSFVRTKIWNQYICKAHQTDGTPACRSCSRIKPRNLPYYNLGHDCYLCADCKSLSIMDKEQLKPLIADIDRFFKENNLQINFNDIPVLMVEKDGFDSPDSAEQEGNAVMAKYQTKEDIVMEVTKSVQKGNDIKVVKKMKAIHANTGAILLLFGTVKAEMGVALVIYRMHTWLHYLDTKLDDTIKDGVCLMAACEWLQSTPFFQLSCTREQDRFLGQMKAHVLYNLENGVARFVRALGKVKSIRYKYGFKYTAAYLAQFKQLPI